MRLKTLGFAEESNQATIRNSRDSSAVPYSFSFLGAMISNGFRRADAADAGAGVLIGLLLPLLCFVDITAADAFVLPADHSSNSCRTCISGPLALPDPSAWSSSTALPCQLLGMNCRTPTDFSFSFRGFARRGGDTDIHRDGWGIAFYEGRGLRTFHDPDPASDSPIAKFVSEYPVLTLNMIAHIRYGTEGKTELANVHPFDRELWGIK